MSMKEDERDQVEQEVLKTLESLDTLENIDVGQYFVTHLQANLESGQEPREAGLVRFLLGRRLVPALLSIVFMANFLTAVMVIRKERHIQSDLRNEKMEALADEYLLTGISVSLDNTTE